MKNHCFTWNNFTKKNHKSKFKYIMEYLKQRIRDVYDFPKKGIVLRISPHFSKIHAVCISSAGTFPNFTATKVLLKL